MESDRKGSIWRLKREVFCKCIFQVYIVAGIQLVEGEQRLTERVGRESEAVSTVVSFVLQFKHCNEKYKPILCP